MAAEVDVTRAKNGSRFALLPVCLVLFATGAGCHSCKTVPPTKPVEDTAANATRIAAMLSIHAHARSAGRGRSGEEPADAAVRSHQLPEEYEITATSRTRGAGGRSKLAGYGLGRKDVDDALEHLGANCHAIFTNGSTNALQPPPTTRRCHPKRSNREAMIYDPFQNLNTENCPTTKLEVYVPDDGLPVATGAARISVGRDLKAVAQALDPQSWDVCSKLPSNLRSVRTCRNPIAPRPLPSRRVRHMTQACCSSSIRPALRPTIRNGNPRGCDAWVP